MNAALTFGAWLKRRRDGLGLTQKELAQQVGYAEVTLRKLEADELRPSREMAEKLAAVLQIAPENPRSSCALPTMNPVGIKIICQANCRMQRRQHMN